jgi:hypothetical protein
MENNEDLMSPTDEIQDEEESIEQIPGDTDQEQVIVVTPSDLEKAAKDYMEMLRENREDIVALKDYLIGINANTPLLRSFVDTNLGSLAMYPNTVIHDAQSKIRKAKSQEEFITYCENQIQDIREFGVALSKMSCCNDRGNKWRQLIAAMSGSVIVPSAMGGEIRMPTGAKSEGEFLTIEAQAYYDTTWMCIGTVSLNNDSQEDYLYADEINRMETGSPRDKKTLRARMVIEAINDQINSNYYYVMNLDVHGKIHRTMIFKPSIFKDAYEKGLIDIVESENDSASWIGVDRNGNVASLLSWTMVRFLDKVEIDSRTNEIRTQAIEIGLIENGNFIFNGTDEDLTAIGGISNTQSAAINDEEWEKIIIMQAGQTSLLLSGALAR